MGQEWIDTNSFENVNYDVRRFYNIDWEKGRISLIKPLNYLVGGAVFTISESADLIKDFLITELGIEQTIATIVSELISAVASLFEVVSLTIASAKPTKMEFTPKTAKVTAS
jgi:hypothetical protein